MAKQYLKTEFLPLENQVNTAAKFTARETFIYGYMRSL